MDTIPWKDILHRLLREDFLRSFVPAAAVVVVRGVPMFPIAVLLHQCKHLVLVPTPEVVVADILRRETSILVVLPNDISNLDAPPGN